MVELPHGRMQAAERRVEVRAGLLERRVPEHVLHMVDRPSAFEQPCPPFIPQVMKVQIDRAIRCL